MEDFRIEVRNDYLEMLSEFPETKEPHYGDIVVMKTHTLVTNHIGVYLRGGSFIHVGDRQNGTVIVSNTKEGYFSQFVVGFLGIRK